MKAKLKTIVVIPKGWHKIRNGTWVESGDRYLDQAITGGIEWRLVEGYRIDYEVGTCRKDEDNYIRKNTRRTV